MMEDLYRQWLDEKLSSSRRAKLKATTISFNYMKALGGRGLYAEVTISARDAEEFSFVSKADWTDFSDFDAAILDGILTAMFAQKSQTLSGGTFTLEAVCWHPVDSCYEAFFMAAKQATREILRQSGYWE